MTMLDMNGLLNAVYDAPNAALRVSGSGDVIPLPATVFGASAGVPLLSFANNVVSFEMDGTLTESVTSSFILPTFWSAMHVDLWHGRRTAGSGNVRHRIIVKDLANNDLVTEAAFSDVSANVAVGTQNAVLLRGDHNGVQAASNNRLYAITYERTAADAGDTYNALDSSFFGISIRRGV